MDQVDHFLAVEALVDCQRDVRNIQHSHKPYDSHDVESFVVSYNYFAFFSWQYNRLEPRYFRLRYVLCLWLLVHQLFNVEAEGEHGPFAPVGLHEDLAVKLLYNLLGNEESEADALGVEAILVDAAEHLKEVALVFNLDTQSRIQHLHHDLALVARFEHVLVELLVGLDELPVRVVRNLVDEQKLFAIVELSKHEFLG